MDIPADLLPLLNAFTVGQLLLDPLNILFNGNNESYVEEIFVDTTVDGILYSVSSIMLSRVTSLEQLSIAEFSGE